MTHGRDIYDMYVQYVQLTLMLEKCPVLAPAQHFHFIFCFMEQSASYDGCFNI